MKTIKEVLAASDVLLADGAIGTELYNRGVFINRCYEEASISDGALVKKLHADYLSAGSEILTTNSWGANRFKLKKFSIEDKVAVINRKSAEIAREIAGDRAYVAGSIGPLGVRIEPWGPTSIEEARAAFREQALALVEGGCDYLSLETFSDLTELRAAVEACQEVVKDQLIAAHLVITTEGKLVLGSPLEWGVKELDTLGVDIMGLNCSVGPAPMLTALKIMRESTKKPISLQPNAGLPKLVDGRSIYLGTPEYMGEFAKNFLQSGVQIVGGCCGTSPVHIKLMSQAFRHFRAMHSGERLNVDATATATRQALKTDAGSGATVSPMEAEEKKRVPFAEKSKWSEKIARGEKVVCCELLPPSSVVPDSILQRSLELKRAGIDAINIPDGPRASARMSAIITAVLIEQKVGIETILHYTCRDRNLLGMQSDMLGAHAIGLRNLLLVTGDPPKIGSYPDATGVFDVDAIGLTNMVHRLNGGTDLGKRDIGTPTAISVGVGVNPVHQDFDYEMKRFKFKVDAGAEWAITQPVFDLNAMFRFLEFIDKHNCKIPIVAGIWPLVSHRNAVFMNNEVPGVVIPKETIDRMAAAGDAEDAKKIGVEIASEMIDTLLSVVDGIQISAPFGRIDLALQAIKPLLDLRK